MADLEVPTESLEDRVENLEATLNCIHWMWKNPYLRRMIEKSLVGDYELVTSANRDRGSYDYTVG